MAKISMGEVILMPSVEMTRFQCAGCTPKSRIFLQEQSEGAVNAQVYIDPDDIGDGEFLIWHNAVSQAAFSYLCIEDDD